MEFNYSCVYCEIRESEYGNAETFRIDHYAPQVHFPWLRTAYFNLFYSCEACNGAKLDHWLYLNEIDHIINPFEEDVDLVLDKSDSRWAPFNGNPTGRFNVERFSLDSDFLAGVRDRRLENQSIMEAIPPALSMLDELQSFAISQAPHLVDEIMNLKVLLGDEILPLSQNVLLPKAEKRKPKRRKKIRNKDS